MANNNIKASIEMEIKRGDDVIDIVVHGSGYYDPGRPYGPIDSSYPAEGEMDITAVELADPVGACVAWDKKLTPEEQSEAIKLLWENCGSDEPDDPPYDEDDFDYDDHGGF